MARAAVHAVLETYFAALHECDAAKFHLMFHPRGVLLGLGSLSEHLNKRKMYKNTLEMLLVMHVFPEFANPNGFLRMRAAWMMHRFAEINFQIAGSHAVGSSRSEGSVG